MADPFGSLVPLCVISNSQQEALLHRPFAGLSMSDDDSDSSDPESYRRLSTEIFMVSPPDSLEQKDDFTSHDVPEQSPPADSDGRRSLIVDDEPADAEHEKAVDLGRDTDLGLYLEVRLTQTGEILNVDESIQVTGVCGSKVSGSEAKGVEIPCSELLGQVRLGEPPSKKLKLSREALASGSCTTNVVEEFPVKVVPVSSLDSNNEMTEKLVMETDSGQYNDHRKDAEKEVADHFPFHPRLRWKNSAPEKLDAGVSILDILQILKEKEESDDDKSTANASILEVAKRRGMTFPHPRWWPEGGFEQKR